MELMYSSTRNGQLKFTASQAILKGLADDGGLFVPETIPSLDVSMDELANMSYQEVAYAVMKKVFSDFTEEELKNVEGEFTPSAFVRTITGVENVCERSAVLGSDNGRLIRKKTGREGVTTALALRKWEVRFE